MTINAAVPLLSSRVSLLTALTVSTTGASPNAQSVQSQDQDQDQDQDLSETKQRPHRALNVPEILNHVGYFLSQKEAVVSVRVSKDWHQVFSPVLWKHVDTSRWSSWLLWQAGKNQPPEPVQADGDKNDMRLNAKANRKVPEELKTTMSLALGILQQALERNGHHIRTLTIVDLRIQGLEQLLDQCHRLETLVLWPDAFEEDVDDDDDDEMLSDDDSEEDSESDEEEAEQHEDSSPSQALPPTEMPSQTDGCKNPIVNLLRTNRNLSRVEIFVGQRGPSGAFWRTLAFIPTTATITPHDPSPLPRGLPPPPKLPPCRGLRSFQSSLGLEIKRMDHLDHFLQMFQQLETLELESCYIAELRVPNSRSKKSKKSEERDSARTRTTPSTLWFPHMRHVLLSRIRSLSIQSQFRILQACPNLESLDWRVPRLGFPVDEFCETLQCSYFSSTLTNTTPRWTRLTSLTLPESRLSDGEFAKILGSMQCGLKCLVVRRSDFGPQALEVLMKGWRNRALLDQLLEASGRRRSSSSSSTLSSGSLSSEFWKQAGCSGSEDEGDWSSESFASQISWERLAQQKGPDHWKTMTKLDLGHCRAVTSVMTQCILRGCAKLESFDGYEIRAEDMIQFDDDKGTMTMESDEAQFSMDLDEMALPGMSKTGLVSPPSSPLLDSPLSASMSRTTVKRRLSQQHYGRSPLWAYSSFEKHDPVIRAYRRDSNGEFTRNKATTRLWWSCDKIRHLDVHITGLGPESDPRHRAVFEQLARLQQLKHLSIGTKRHSSLPVRICSLTSVAAAADNTLPVSMHPEIEHAITTSLPSPPSSPPTEYTSRVAPLSATALFKYPGMGSHSSLSSTYHSAENRIMSPAGLGGLDLRLRSGLSLLAPLKKLRVLRFKGLETMMPEATPHFFEKDTATATCDHHHHRHRSSLKTLDLEEEDVQWMVDHFWDLKIVEGTLHSDEKKQKRLVSVLESRGVDAWTSFNLV
ncbi:hypothetical protein EMPS_06432 [Entomortierella parvispora]|uniref:F-box domain-containing protein n=1 Tax=Entomortierella parvispora TaxID=205924 RepID=A0A9P3HC98_9FUNG|nr:hypothetical protein EMPS_06432 [Entomortierella parvispora]